ncbi:MAG: DUF2190 family protein [Pseudomonadota bacterium]
MKNFVQQGNVITTETPVGGILSGQGLLSGYLFGVAATTQTEGDHVALHTQGVFDLAKTSGQSYAFGDRIYWDATARAVTSTSSGNRRIGIAVEAAAAGATTARVRLDGHAV